MSRSVRSSLKTPVDTVGSGSLAITELPFETEQLRTALGCFLDQTYQLQTGEGVRLGSIKWGVYAFFDYDNEPIYVGQTKERLGTRIRRHLTNQRTDAVAMNVLDPFEVHSIAVWPLPDFETRSAKDAEAIAHLNALESAVFCQLLEKSEFNAVLNEKDPPSAAVSVEIPTHVQGSIVPESVRRLRSHPDLRIARRAATLAKLAQVISERKVQKGLRRTLLAQAKRLQALAARRLAHSAEFSSEDNDDDV
ncbi:MAG: excinuclease ABC subunit C [Ideonella sp. MAG2]|nr:MAG: excinuclease ABC subunit C [Ideonella sp. MAG2]